MAPSTPSPPSADPRAFWLGAARAILLIFLALVPAFFWRGALEPFESCKAGLLHLAALLLGGCLLCAGFRSVGRFWREPIGLALLLGLASAAVSTALSLSPRTSFWGAWDSHQGLLTVASLFVLFLAGRTLFPVGGVRPVVLAVAGGVVVCAGYALLQTLRADPFAWTETSPYHGFTRPTGTQGHPNYLGGFLVMALPLLAWRWLAEPRRLALLVPLGLACLAAIASLSRAAWLAGFVLVLLPLLRLSPRRRLWVGAAAAVCVGLLALLAWLDLLGPLGQRVRHLGESSSRLAMWRVSANIFLDAPLTGSGLDTFQLAFTRHRTAEYWDHEWGFTPTHAHNEPLHLLATQGAAGGLCYLLLAGAVLVAAWRAWRDRPSDRGLVLALAGVSLAYHLQNLLGFPVIATAGLHAVALGCLSRLSSAEATDSPAPAARWPVAAGAALACLVLPLNVLAEAPGRGTLWQPALLAGLTAAMLLAVWWREARAVGVVLASGAVVVVVLTLAWVVAARPFAAWCLVRQGQAELAADPARALRCFERAVATAPWLDGPVSHLAAARHRVALLHGKADLVRAAADAAEAARDRVPASATHHAVYARIALDLARQGQAPPQAVWRSFGEALSRDPLNTLLILDAARAALLLGDLDRARDYLRRGREIDPDLTPLIAEEGILALAEGRPEEAERSLIGTLEGDWRGQTEAQGRAHGLLAVACFQRGRFDVALEQADLVLAIYPRPNTFEVGTRWVRAAALERLGRVDDARWEAVRILTLKPDHAPSHELLRRTLRRPPGGGPRPPEWDAPSEIAESRRPRWTP